ncbi:MAG: HAF repeat-containing protein [Pseudomonadota bacterium]
MFVRTCFFISFIAGSLLAPLVQAAPTYTLTFLPQGASAHGINNAGQIVGDYSAGDNAHAFVWSGAALADLGSLGGGPSSGTSINRYGDVTGSSTLDASTIHAFAYAGGAMKDLGTLGGPFSIGTGINAAGQVAGQSLNGQNQYRAFLYASGSMQDLGTLGGDFGRANGINSAAQVVGESALDRDVPELSTHAFLYSAGAMVDLGTLGGRLSDASAINDAGQVIGTSLTASNFEHAFLYSNGTMRDIGSFGGQQTFARGINGAGMAVGSSEYVGSQDLAHAWLFANDSLMDLNSLVDPVPGWTLVDAVGINDARQIAGLACRDFGDCRAVRLDPVSAVPEPAGALLFLTGLMLVGVAAQRNMSTCRMPSSS